jgi:hypothetical protein
MKNVGISARVPLFCHFIASYGNLCCGSICSVPAGCRNGFPTDALKHRNQTMRTLFCMFAVTVALFAGRASALETKNGLDDEGFVLKWLVATPIALGDGQSIGDGLGAQQIADEAKLKPAKDGKVKAGTKELVWKEHTSSSYVIDLNAISGGETNDAVAYAVSYVTSATEQKVSIKLGCDDAGKVYVNGKEVVKYEGERALEKDQDTAEVTLNKGVNVVVVKVVNAKVDWSFCVRFVDKDGKPAAGVSAKSAE